jgi:hypothetical protein
MDTYASTTYILPLQWSYQMEKVLWKDWCVGLFYPLVYDEKFDC